MINHISSINVATFSPLEGFATFSPRQVVFPIESEDGWGSFDHTYSANERVHKAFHNDWTVRRHHA